MERYIRGVYVERAAATRANTHPSIVPTGTEPGRVLKAASLRLLYPRERPACPVAVIPPPGDAESDP